jgi:protein phosphatase
MTGLAFRTACVTNIGLARELNEDSILVRPDIGLWVVADGMGGYGGGNVASGAVVAALETLAPSGSAAHLLAEFERRIIRVNADLRALARARAGVIVGTTLAALIVHGTHFACVWCGDSRVYLRRDGRLAQVSRDHSEVQELVDRGLLRQEEAMAWPRRNVVTRALGARDDAELEIVDGPAYAGDRFLLCSDGLTAHVADDEIAALLGAVHPQTAVDNLLHLTLKRGASDNVSIIVVDCKQADPAHAEDSAGAAARRDSLHELGKLGVDVRLDGRKGRDLRGGRAGGRTYARPRNRYD